MKKILVIDDEQGMLDMLSGFLSQRGYAVVTALDGEEGLQKFNADKPDVVLCDIKMPRKDGFQFLKEVRSMRGWVPIIIVSAVDDPVSILKGYNFRADFYLTKPIDLNKTLEAIQIMISLTPLRKNV